VGGYSLGAHSDIANLAPAERDNGRGFYLAAPGGLGQLATLQRCRIVWRHDHQIGVEFEGRDIPVHEPTGPENAHQFESAARSKLRRWVSELRGLLLF